MLTFYLFKTMANGENELGQEIFEYKKVAEFIGYMDMLDGNESADASHAQPGRDDVLVGFGRGKFDVDGLFALLDRTDEVGQVHIGVGTDDQIHVVVADEFVLDAFGHTTEYAHDGLPTFLFQ